MQTDRTPAPRQGSSFWDGRETRSYSNLPPFLSEADTERLIDEETPLEITEVEHDPAGKFGPRYLVRLLVDGQPVVKSFQTGSVEGRDDLLADMKTHLEAGGEEIRCRFVRWGRAVGIEPTEEAPA
jgi:hypothetical protein